MSYSRRYRDNDYYRNAQDYLSDYYGTNDQDMNSGYYGNERSNRYARNDSRLPGRVYRGEQGRFPSTDGEVSTRNCDRNRVGDCYASDYLRRHNIYRSKTGQFRGGGDSYPTDCNPNRAGDCEDESSDEYDDHDSGYRRRYDY